MARLRITWTKSTIGREDWQARIITSLGLKKLHQSVEHEDTPTIRGMLQKVPHLVTVEAVASETAERKPRASRSKKATE
jgi:large subunit ribosomal protein L30